MTKFITCFIAFLLILSCNVKKRVTAEVIHKADTVQHSTSMVNKSEASLLFQRTTKDTVIKIASRTITDTLTIADLQSVYNKEGKILPRQKVLRGSGVSVTTTTLPSGQMVITALCDSLEQLIPGMTDIIISQRSAVDSLSSLVKDYKSSDLLLKQTETTQKSYWWILWLILSVSIGGYIAFKILKIVV